MTTSPAEADASGAVVVPGVCEPSSTAVLRSLGRRGVDTVAVSEHAAPPSFVSRYCDEAVRVPSSTTASTAYRDALLSLARRESVRAVVPMRESDAYVLARDREAFAAHVAPVWPTADQLAAVQDRVRLYDLADRLDVPHPRTELLGAVSSWDRDLVVKARYALVADAYVDGASPDDARSPPKTVFLDPGVRPDVAAIRERMGHEPIAQEFVAGPEYSFRALFDRGEPVSTSLKRLVRGIKYTRGPSVCHRTVSVPALEAHGLALLEHLDWHGPASVGFIADPETGEYLLTEVNPRFWANLPMDVQAGVDMPHHYWCLATDRRESVASSYHAGTTTHYLMGELGHLQSVALGQDCPLVERPSLPRATWDVLTSVLADRRFDLLSRDDPRPFVRDAVNKTKLAVGDSFRP